MDDYGRGSGVFTVSPRSPIPGMPRVLHSERRLAAPPELLPIGRMIVFSSTRCSTSLLVATPKTLFYGSFEMIPALVTLSLISNWVSQSMMPFAPS